MKDYYVPPLIRGLQRRIHGDRDLVADLERPGLDTVLQQCVGPFGKFEGPSFYLSVLAWRFDLKERMRVSQQDADNLALDLDFPFQIVGAIDVVMRGDRDAG